MTNVDRLNASDPGKYGSDAVAEAADPASWEMWPAPETHREVLYQRFPEFTCLCPRSGYPDFATLHLVTIPTTRVIELKHLKLWLNSYRERQISHELAAAEIIDTLVERLDLAFAFILMEYTPRGNLLTIPMIEHRAEQDTGNRVDRGLAAALANAERVRDQLIVQVISADR